MEINVSELKVDLKKSEANKLWNNEILVFFCFSGKAALAFYYFSFFFFIFPSLHHMMYLKYQGNDKKVIKSGIYNLVPL